MFGGTNYSKLKTNLKLSIQRLKLMELKKTENSRKASKEIADYITINKLDRARIRVEHIIREDYAVEGMEIVEMYCDLLLARFGLLQSIKVLEPDLQECVSSILWAAPRLESECPELKIVADELAHKFGSEYARECKASRMTTVNQKLMQKLNEQAPGDLIVEKYIVEIAQSFKVPYKPDPNLAIRDYEYFYNFNHLDQPNNNNNTNNQGGNSGGSGSGGGMASAMDRATPEPVNPASIYPSPTKISHIGFNVPAPAKPTKKQTNDNVEPPSNEFNLNLPDVPSDIGNSSFDDLSKRFENLKKK